MCIRLDSKPKEINTWIKIHIIVQKQPNYWSFIVTLLKIVLKCNFCSAPCWSACSITVIKRSLDFSFSFIHINSYWTAYLYFIKLFYILPLKHRSSTELLLYFKLGFSRFSIIIAQKGRRLTNQLQHPLYPKSDRNNQKEANFEKCLNLCSVKETNNYTFQSNPDLLFVLWWLKTRTRAAEEAASELKKKTVHLLSVSRFCRNIRLSAWNSSSPRVFSLHRVPLFSILSPAALLL